MTEGSTTAQGIFWGLQMVANLTWVSSRKVWLMEKKLFIRDGKLTQRAVRHKGCFGWYDVPVWQSHHHRQVALSKGLFLLKPKRLWSFIKAELPLVKGNWKKVQKKLWRGETLTKTLDDDDCLLLFKMVTWPWLGLSKAVHPVQGVKSLTWINPWIPG